MGARRTQTIGNVSARSSTTAVTVRRGSPDSRATTAALLISMAARLSAMHRSTTTACRPDPRSGHIVMSPP